MHRFRVWGLSTALAVGLGGAALAADLPTDKPSMMQKLFGQSKSKQPGPTVAPQRPMTITAPLPPEVLKEALRAEQEAYLRRVSVCTEFRRIAVERGDESLFRQADDLERQAGAIYNARVAALGVSKTKAPMPEPSLAAREANSTRMAASQLSPPTAPVPGTTTAQIREIQP
jgi:hypothetical protein